MKKTNKNTNNKKYTKELHVIYQNICMEDIKTHYHLNTTENCFSEKDFAYYYCHNDQAPKMRELRFHLDICEKCFYLYSYIFHDLNFLKNDFVDFTFENMDNIILNAIEKIIMPKIKNEVENSKKVVD